MAKSPTPAKKMTSFVKKAVVPVVALPHTKNKAAKKAAPVKAAKKAAPVKAAKKAAPVKAAKKAK